VVPVALGRLWGSFFSRIEGGRAMARPFRRGLFNRIEVVVGAPLAPAELTPEALRARIAAQLGDAGPGAPRDAGGAVA
jgi:hypothetical protein